MTREYLNMPDSEVAGWVRGPERHWTTERPASLLLRKRIENKWNPPPPPPPSRYGSSGGYNGDTQSAGDRFGGRWRNDDTTTGYGVAPAPLMIRGHSGLERQGLANVAGRGAGTSSSARATAAGVAGAIPGSHGRAEGDLPTEAEGGGALATGAATAAAAASTNAGRKRGGGVVKEESARERSDAMEVDGAEEDDEDEEEEEEVGLGGSVGHRPEK